MSYLRSPLFNQHAIETQVNIPANALVTGANRGIGLAVSRALAKLGTHVILAGRDEDAVLRECRILADEGFDVDTVIIDVADAASVRAGAQRLRRRGLKSLDLLINNAGSFESVPAEEMEWVNIEPLLRVNTGGAANMIHDFLPDLCNAATPRIINVSSATASMTLLTKDDIPAGEWRRRAGYAVSKAALNMLTSQYATLFRKDQRYTHLTINSVAPPYTATRMNGFEGDHSVEKAAELIVKLAKLPVSGPNGSFFDEHGSIAW